MNTQNETRARIAILGAGPTGLGAAWRLANKLDVESSRAETPKESLPFLLLDGSPTPGGRAASFTTDEEFTFDYGGHVLFAHPEYREFANLLDSVVSEWHYSVPVRGVWINGTILPAPVQRNIHHLPLGMLIACLWGLLHRKSIGNNSVEPNLHQYLDSVFGTHLTKHVMGPLNHKMWAHPLDELGSAWSTHRSGSKEKNIPDVHVGKIVSNLLLNRDDPGWTDTTTVRYPLRGGMGAIWDRIFLSLPSGCKSLSSSVAAINAADKRLLLNDGTAVRYDHLVTSIPLNSLLDLLTDQPRLSERSKDFHVSRVQLFGFGIIGPMPVILNRVHAFNVPSPDIQFWRVNIPSNFSPGNIPTPDNTWSILCECSSPPHLATDYTSGEIVKTLREMKLLPSDCTVVSEFTSKLQHGYPVPFYGRDVLINEVQEGLESLDIYSRGRFGGWRYEVSNQDHAFMQGVEIIDRLCDGKPEYTYRKTW
jgi:protoporphyrinogen oxidase